MQGVRTGDELQKLADTYNHMIGELLSARRQSEAFGKYLSRAARDAAEQGNVHLGGTTLPATVLFSDIRSFTTLCERMEPEHVLSLLNRYFTEMVGAVVRHQGIVDKFIGDCIMAVWGPPNPRPADTLNAVKAAIEMRERLVKLNVAFAAAGLPQFRAGIGIHTGQVVAGNMGAETTADVEGKMEYTVIGDTVNLASRLETMTKELKCDVLLSEDTYRARGRRGRSRAAAAHSRQGPRTRSRSLSAHRAPARAGGRRRRLTAFPAALAAPLAPTADTSSR